jgi:hypothetical protein
MTNKAIYTKKLTDPPMGDFTPFAGLGSPDDHG